MARHWEPRAFDRAYAEFVCQESFPFGTPDYYARYRSRYKLLLERFSSLAPPTPVDVLDVGGGQLALLAKTIWADRATVSDLPGQPQLDYLQKFGITPLPWNLCAPDQPRVGQFDFIFFSEVIEHLPVPGHVVLGRLRQALKPGGTLICSTRIFTASETSFISRSGLPIFDHMDLPGESSLGHVIEYSRDDLQWHIERAGFARCRVEYRQMHHAPTDPVFRVMSWVGYPLFLVPHFRDNLVAIASAPLTPANA